MKAFAGVKDEYVTCRTIGHRWDTIPFDGKGPQWARNVRSVETLLFRCVGCRGKRYDQWSKATGDLIDRSYDMPDGYALTRDAQATRANMRIEALERGLMYLEDRPVKAKKAPQQQMAKAS